MPTWPTTGGFPPAPLRGSWQRQRQKNTTRFDPDVGPPLVRKRSTVSTLMATFNILLTTAQLATLDTFYADDCNEGATPFDFENPETEVTEAWSWDEPPAVSDNGQGSFIVGCKLRRDY